VKNEKRNFPSKIFALGDIHGCREKLHALLKRVRIDFQNDILIFLGDYIDRGRYSREVVEDILQLRQDKKNVICLLGNHEQMFLNYLDGVEEDLFLHNGGAFTLASYGISTADNLMQRKKQVPYKHRQFFESLLPYYEAVQYIFVHAGLEPGISLKSQETETMIWIRHEFIDTDYHFGKTVIFGHTPMTEPLITDNKIGIDTGAVYGGKLTCLELPEIKIHQV
jgi:serine/threonine protein phosphatase 1